MTGTRARWIGLVFISIAVSLIIVDSTIINVAIPSIVADLNITSTQVQWVQESYTLVFAALLLVFGTLADRFGRRRLMMIGVVIFALSSVLAGLAQSGELLIGARVLQGVGGAMILPTTLSLINSTFRGRDRGIAFAIWGSTIGGMAAVGPLLGGWLTTYYSWRWAFGINVPLGIIILIGVLIFVIESREAGARRVDVVGAMLSVLTNATLVFGLIEGRSYGWWTPVDDLEIGDWSWPLPLSPIPLSFAVAVVSGALFIWWGLRRARRNQSTMLAFGLFRIPSFRNGNIAAMVVSLGEFGIILSLPLWLQNVLGYDALHTGYVLLSLAIGSFVASGFAGAFGSKLSPVLIVRIGLLAEIVGVAAVGLSISTDTAWYAVAAPLFVYGFGVGLATAQLTGVVLKDVPIEQSGQGSGTQSTSRQIGSALGIAILGTILFSTLGGQLDARLADRDIPEATRSEIVDAVVGSAGSAISGLDAQFASTDSASADSTGADATGTDATGTDAASIANDAREAFSEATRYSAFAAAGFLSLGFLATLRLDNGIPKKRDETDTSRDTGAATADDVDADTDTDTDTDTTEGDVTAAASATPLST